MFSFINLQNFVNCQEYGYAFFLISPKRLKKMKQEPSKKLYFTRQTIGNACGTVGIIHALGNAASKIKIGISFSFQ